MDEETVVDLDEHRKPTQLPEPVGYQLLIALPESKGLLHFICMYVLKFIACFISTM